MIDNRMHSWIKENTDDLRQFFRVTPERWNHLVGRLQKQLEAPRPDFYDEVVWTFLLGLSYGADGWEGIRKLESILSGAKVDPYVEHPLWLEALPVPPRKSEGNTNVDLAIFGQCHVAAPAATPCHGTALSRGWVDRCG